MLPRVEVQIDPAVVGRWVCAESSRGKEEVSVKRIAYLRIDTATLRRLFKAMRAAGYPAVKAGETARAMADQIAVPVYR